MPDRIEAFIEAVAAEIRWKKARPVLTEELRTHLLDQRDAYAAQGMAEDEAQAAKALAYIRGQRDITVEEVPDYHA